MARRIAMSNLNARTIDIINTIRQHASYEYQSMVPVVSSEIDIPKVGDVLYGYPALANQFLQALINRIALVKIKSANFYNTYSDLKKGYLETGESVEEVFINIGKAREFSAEKAESRELKRTLPDVRTAFHTMNWRVQYPVTIEDEDLRMAFTSIDGVQDLIAKIVNSVYTANEYDEYLLFKYLLIKSISRGKLYPVEFDASNMNNAAKSFRGMSNLLTFIKTDYNEEGVHVSTPREDQVIFMDSKFNAEYDVDVLAAAFNMEKAEFMGKLYLIDDWTTFDNDRFSEIKANSDMIEDVTVDELALMEDVKAVLCDQEFFQVYDNANKFTETYVASGMRWNYFYNVWKTISISPFSNAVVFVDSSASTALPASFDIEVQSKTIGEGGTIFTLVLAEDEAALAGGNVTFTQNETAVKAGIAIHPYGSVIFPPASNTELTLTATVNGKEYSGKTKLSTSNNVGATFTLSDGTNPPSPPPGG